MSTLSDLMSADLKESSARFNRYWRASSLPLRERRRNRPRQKPLHRDRVLVKLMELGLNRLVISNTKGA